MIIVGREEWKKEYRKNKHNKVWIVLEIEETQIYLEDFDDWLEFKKKYSGKSLRINSLGLQYKSHLVSTNSKDADGLYLIRSVKGMMGGESIDTYTTGIIRGDKVEKTMWSIPALIPESEFEDEIENCFEEAIIKNDKEIKT